MRVHDIHMVQPRSGLLLDIAGDTAVRSAQFHPTMCVGWVKKSVTVTTIPAEMPDNKGKRRWVPRNSTRQK